MAAVPHSCPRVGEFGWPAGCVSSPQWNQHPQHLLDTLALVLTLLPHPPEQGQCEGLQSKGPGVWEFRVCLLYPIPTGSCPHLHTLMSDTSKYTSSNPSTHTQHPQGYPLRVHHFHILPNGHRFGTYHCPVCALQHLPHCSVVYLPIPIQAHYCSTTKSWHSWGLRDRTMKCFLCTGEYTWTPLVGHQERVLKLMFKHRKRTNKDLGKGGSWGGSQLVRVAEGSPLGLESKL